MIEIAVDFRKPPFRNFFTLLVIFILGTGDLAAQGTGGSSILLYALIIAAALLLIGAVMQVADNYLRVESGKHRIHSEGLNMLGTLAQAFKATIPAHIKDEDVYVLKRGFDIKVEGAAQPVIKSADQVTRYAVQPTNFKGLAPIPKVVVDIGDTVKAGQPILYDKSAPDILYVAPVSGEVLEINRGAKRAIAEVVILADKEIQHVQHEVPDLESAGRDDIVSFLLSSGAWSLLRERPYDLIPDPAGIPSNIFISTFDSGPGAPDSNLIVQGRGEDFQKGLDVLNKLTSGTIHLGLDGRGDANASAIFVNALGAEKHWFRGPHPCGNVGVQIHHVAPLTASSKVWILGVQEVLALGKLFITGQFDGCRIVALTGAPLKQPEYVQTYIGAHIGELLKDNVEGENLRYISGDILSGSQKTRDGYLNFYDDQVSVIREGNYYEMFGWLLPLSERPSVSKTYPNFLFPDIKFDVNTNMHGEKRAFVMTGQYESMLPMDIYPQHLMKAILANDIEKMEGLGIYELTEEDIALCEFACTSKQPLQQILRDGQQVMIEQS